MLRQRLAVTSAISGFTLLTSFGCAREVPQDPVVDLTKVTIAQFDPTNPIPVLQLIPSPTALAQNLPPDTTINQAAVAPEPCELPTLAQCLKFVSGWSTSTFPTLYFSRAPDPASIPSGVVWLKVTATGVVPVSFTSVTRERTPVNAACMNGDNGSDPARTYTAEDIPPGVETVLIPDQPLEPGTTYLLALKSTETGGLRGPDGDVVAPSALFSILNTPDGVEPVLADGTIADGLLRSQVQGSAINKLYAGKLAEDLTADELKLVQAEMAMSAARLRPLYLFISGLVKTFVGAGVAADRTELVFVNTWTTGAASPGEIRFDPANAVVPLFSTQLNTVADMTTATGRAVKLPDDNSSPTRAALIRGLNTLDGFALLAPVLSVTANVLIDDATLDGNVAMYALDETGNATGESIPLTILTSSVSTATTAITTIRLVARGPLAQASDYVVVIKKGVTNNQGQPLVTNSTYNLLALQSDPFIDANGSVQGPLIEQALQCRTVPTTGRLAGDEEVKGTAALLENQLNHQGWVSAFDALQNHTVPANQVPRDQILMAWTYTTQSLTPTVQAIKTKINDATWDMVVPGPSSAVAIPPTPIDGTASIAATVQVVPTLCVPICLQGEMEPAIPRAECATFDAMGNITAVDPRVPGNQVCQLAVNIIAGQLQQASLIAMKGYELRAGSPYTAGTFDPMRIRGDMPGAAQHLIWVIEPSGTRPAGGWPVAIFQHGIGQVKESGFYIANTLARKGIATVLMDLPFHGTRASDLTAVMNTPLGPQEVPCTDGNGIPNVDPADVMCDPQTGACIGGCDGVRDSSGTGYLSSNLFGARDNFRQTIVDQLTLIAAIKANAMTGMPLEMLDGTQIGYIGQSLGAITGANLAAFATPDELSAQVLNVGGGDLITVLLNAIPAISAPLFVALNASGVCDYVVPNDPTSGCQPTLAFLEFLSTARWVLEPGDPAALSQAVPGGVGNANILMQMSLPDPVVNNQASFILAGTYGFLNAQGMPATPQFQIYDFSALPQATVGSGCHGWILAPTCGVDLVDTLCNSIGAQEQAAEFLLDQATVAPQRPGTVAGVPCP